MISCPNRRFRLRGEAKDADRESVFFGEVEKSFF
jgi:hypothetical protein